MAFRQTTMQHPGHCKKPRGLGGARILAIGAAVAVILAQGGVATLRAATPGELAGAMPPSIDFPSLLPSSTDLAPTTPFTALGLDVAAPAVPELQIATHQGGSGPSSGQSSGGGWKSGAACHTSAFDSWRGRPSDVYAAFSGRENFPAVVNTVKGNYIRGFASKRGDLSLGLALLTDNTRGKWSDCNSGKFDGYFREIGKALKSHGLGDCLFAWDGKRTAVAFPGTRAIRSKPTNPAFVARPGISNRRRPA